MSANEEIKEPILPAENSEVKTDKKVRSIMMWASIVIALVVIGTIAYIFGYRQPAIEKGNEAIGEADRIALFQNNDSLALATYQQVADNYGFDAGNRAKLSAAIILYRQGNYEDALKYVSDYKATDNVIGATALALKGDCLVNLDKNADAIKAYDKAIKQADNNPQLVPYLLNKKAVVLMSMEKWNDAAKVYKTIETDYPEFAASVNAEGRRLQCESLAK
ncbi:MAG: tetratricopeptide repeat protein [Muribaculaceae bacterium]|nr:tetratricopeptide repeat protein [Muribaculaceae bacterium]MDE7110558.1 tetratricopeptide repeat protein [Muribaculaceae bacterium]